MRSRRFAFGSDLELVIRASGRDLRHFEAEYGPGRESSSADADVVVTLRRGGTATRRYKTVHWGLAVDARDRRLRAELALGGRPRSFGLSLVQGYFVEPLLSLVAPAAGYVLLPAAGFSVRGQTVVLMGRSRVGKSSVAAQMLAGGHAFLGDDQILIDAAGRATRFPRRLRLYSDLAVTAPDAYRSLGRSAKAGLLLRQVVKHGTRGYVAPPVRVLADELGPNAGVPSAHLPIDTVIHVVRGSGDVVRDEPITADAAVGLAVELLRLQRTTLLETVPALAAHAAEGTEAEREILRSAFASTRTEELRLPSSLTAPAAIALLGRRLGI